jgi:hypothetical protein
LLAWHYVLLWISVALMLVYAAIETVQTPSLGDLSSAAKVVKVIVAFVGLLATGVAVVGGICAWAYKVGSSAIPSFCIG